MKKTILAMALSSLFLAACGGGGDSGSAGGGSPVIGSSGNGSINTNQAINLDELDSYDTYYSGSSSSNGVISKNKTGDIVFKATESDYNPSDDYNQTVVATADKLITPPYTKNPNGLIEENGKYYQTFNGVKIVELDLVPISLKGKRIFDQDFYLASNILDIGESSKYNAYIVDYKFSTGTYAQWEKDNSIFSDDAVCYAIKNDRVLQNTLSFDLNVISFDASKPLEYYIDYEKEHYDIANPLYFANKVIEFIGRKPEKDEETQQLWYSPKGTYGYLKYENKIYNGFMQRANDTNLVKRILEESEWDILAENKYLAENPNDDSYPEEGYAEKVIKRNNEVILPEIRAKLAIVSKQGYYNCTYYNKIAQNDIDNALRRYSH